jgi:hypothetical protein
VITSTTTAVIWRRLDQPGHDSARLTMASAGAVIEGTAVFRESSRPCRLDYRVECDTDGRTVSTRVRGWLGESSIALDITADLDRAWTMNGRPCAEVMGCDDVDLSFTPATNLLAMRRLRLAVGDRAAVRAAWLDFPNVALAPLDQVYERVSASRYRYESSGGFTALLDIGESGFISHYPGLWQCE